jgi:hypothetical protein
VSLREEVLGRVWACFYFLVGGIAGGGEDRL